MSEGDVEAEQGADSSAQNEAIEKAGRLASMLLEMPERLAGNGDEEILQQGLNAIKHVVGFALSSESKSLEALRTYFIPLLEDKSQEDRTRSKKGSKKRKRKGPNLRLSFLDPTPLDGLTVENVNEEQLWHQLELKNEKMVALLGAAMVETNTEQEDLEKELEEEDLEMVDEVEDKEKRKGKKQPGRMPEEEAELEASEAKVLHSIKDLSDDQLRSLGIDPERREEIEMLEDGSEEDEEEDDDLLDESDEGVEDEEESFGYPGASDLSDDDEMRGKVVKEPLKTEEQQRKRQAQVAAEEKQQAKRQMRLRKLMGIRSEDEEEGDEYEFSSDEDEDNEDGDYEEAGENEEEKEEEEEEDDDTHLQSEVQVGKRGLPLAMDQLDGRNDVNAVQNKVWKSHATLDDDFFSIDQFNKDTDDYGDEGVDLGEDVDLFKLIGEEDEDEQPILYGDFFAPPPGMSLDVQRRQGREKILSGETMSAPSTSLQRKVSVRFEEEVAVRRIKARRSKEIELTDELLQSLERERRKHGGEEEGSDRADGEEEDDVEDDEKDTEGGEDREEEEEEEEEEEGDDKTRPSNGTRRYADGSDEEEVEEDSDQGDGEMEGGKLSGDELFDAESDEEQKTAHRVAGDLFADEEQEQRGTNGPVQSQHERRLEKLQEEIAKLERENVGQKDWTLMGETGSRARPENSLLAESLDFENNQRVKPVTTEETTATLEDMIKKRILESNFDDVERRANMQSFDFIPSKILELSDTKSGESLDKVYEDEMGLGGGESHGDKMNKQLEQDHDEIRRLYDELEYKLDALSNAHFTPQAPKASIQTISNTPAITMEESLPSVSNFAAQLAPEEVYDAGRHSSALQGERSEMTPEEKRRLQRQLRADKKARNERIDSVKKNVEINGQALSNTRGGRFIGPSKRAGGNRNDAKEKEEALDKLMGNKGVSVVGKDGDKQKEGNKKRRIERDTSSLNASHLKL